MAYHAPRGYLIPDEPSPGALSRFAVSPTMALFGFMLCGAFVGLPWIGFNGFAIGSATRRREAVIALGGLGLTVVLGGILLLLANWLGLPRASLRYIGLGLHAVRLGAAYSAFLLQSRSFELYEHFGGTVQRQAWWIIAVVFFVRFYLLASLDRGLFTLFFLV